jgi:DNA-binding SARP family transcriptional activator
VLGCARRAKQRALLALLVIHEGETLSTDRLIDELWGEHPPATAAKTVQVHISRLRKALEQSGAEASSEMIVTRERGYELRVEPERIDAHRFDRLIIEGRRELVAPRPERAVLKLEEAMSLWRGPRLSEFAYEQFAQDEIARLVELRVGALEALIDAKLALGRHAEVVGTLEQLNRDPPYRERLRGQQMLAFYRCDRQADALQAYQVARRKLVEELGIEPGERLRDLERAILAQDPALVLASAESAVTKPAAQVPGIAFVGREHELGELIAGLEDACAGRGRLFVPIGEPGIGKSRLAEELIVRAEARGVRVLIGRWRGGGRRTRVLAVDPGAERLGARGRAREAARSAGARRRRTCEARPGVSRAAARASRPYGPAWRRCPVPPSGRGGGLSSELRVVQAVGHLPR